VRGREAAHATAPGLTLVSMVNNCPQPILYLLRKKPNLRGMEIETITYSEFDNEPREWRLEPTTIGPVTLIVGKNASGKTRTLNLVGCLAALLSGERKANLTSGNFSFKFRDKEGSFVYQVRIRNGQVEHESFHKNDKLLLKRNKDGAGIIWVEKARNTMEFHAPEYELAAVVRRDNIQHPFFDKLYQWAKGVRHFQFGSNLGKDTVVVLRDEDKIQHNPKDTNAAVATYIKGVKEFGTQFTKAICEDMAQIDYKITNVGVATPKTVSFDGPIGGAVVALFVQEENLMATTEQHEMSQGMFRVLSIIIQNNYATFSKSPSCILIDDIGEGLDFERSCALVKLLIERETRNGVQLIMTTNDRFVMNAVPLEHWAVIQRKGSTCRYFNSRNAKEKFEEFKFTGMNNFDFFASDFLNSN